MECSSIFKFIPKNRCPYFMHTYTPFCIIAIAHSRWTLCEHGRIWQPLKASWNKEPINKIKKKCLDCDLIILIFFRRISTQEMQAPDVTMHNRWIKPIECKFNCFGQRRNLLEDISTIPYSYPVLMSNYVTTSKQMQHSSCPEFARQECFPSSRLSRQTLHTSQWKERSL